MQRLGLVRVSLVVAALVSLTQCATGPSGSTGSGGSDGSGSGGSSASGGTTGSGGSGSGGSGSGGSSASGGNTGSGGSGSGGSVSAGGNTGTGGAKGGTTGSGGSGSGGSGSGGSSTGGNTGTGGTPTGGTTGSGGSTGTGGSGTDQGGVALATAPSSGNTCLSASKQYFNLGDIRLINNRWGSDALNCGGTQQSVCITSSKTLSWMFNRGNCGETNHSDPDFPEIEFGVAPFGMTSSLLTSPNFSSTTLLPIQISAIQSASVTLSSFDITFSSPTYWDANFEFWISKNDPTKNADAGVYAEIIIFLGWEANRQNGTAKPAGWACSVPGSSGPVSAGTSLTLCHQRDDWGGSNNTYWRFFNFVAGDGSDGNSSMSIGNGGSGQKYDIKALLSWIMSNYQNPATSGTDPAKGNATAQFSSSMWLTRIEVGTEIDDSTVGNTTVKNVTFEINGTSKSPTFSN